MYTLFTHTNARRTLNVRRLVRVVRCAPHTTTSVRDDDDDGGTRRRRRRRRSRGYRARVGRSPAGFGSRSRRGIPVRGRVPTTKRLSVRGVDLATTTKVTMDDDEEDTATTREDDVVCEIACVSPMVIAAAVGTATKGIEEDATTKATTTTTTEAAPGRGEGSVGRAGEGIEATTTGRNGGGTDEDARERTNGAKRDDDDDEGEAREEKKISKRRRRKERHRARKKPGGTDARGVERAVVPNGDVAEDDDDVDDSREGLDPGEEPYVRFEHLFGAADKFATSSSRARGAQVEMYVQDYMERNVYGYAHVSVRTQKGRGRNVSRHVTMKRRTVGRGRPEDALDFPERAVADRTKPTAPPLQSLPMAFAMARGDKIAVATKPKMPTANVPATEKTAAKSPGGVKAKRGASLGGAPPHMTLRIPETIFDDGLHINEDDALMLNDDMVFWNALGDGVECTERGADTAARTVANMRAAREATQSPSVQSGETESPTCLNAAERRVHALERKLARVAAVAAQAKSASPDRPPRKPQSRASYEEHADDRGGLQAINARTHSPQFDDTANREMSSLEAAKKQRSNSGNRDAEREHATSAPSSLQVERLHEAIITLERRQQRMEIERAKHLEEMLHTQHEHRKRVETIIETYERKIELLSRGRAMSSAEFSPTQLHTPPVYHPHGEASRHHHTMMGGAFTAPHRERSGKDPREYTGDTYAPIPSHGYHDHHHNHNSPRLWAYDSFPSSYRPDERRTYSEPRRAGAFGSVLEREFESMEHALRRKNEVIASLSRELGSGGRWN